MFFIDDLRGTVEIIIYMTLFTMLNGRHQTVRCMAVTVNAFYFFLTVVLVIKL